MSNFYTASSDSLTSHACELINDYCHKHNLTYETSNHAAHCVFEDYNVTNRDLDSALEDNQEPGPVRTLLLILREMPVRLRVSREERALDILSYRYRLDEWDNAFQEIGGKDPYDTLCLYWKNKELIRLGNKERELINKVVEASDCYAKNLLAKMWFFTRNNRWQDASDIIRKLKEVHINCSEVIKSQIDSDEAAFNVMLETIDNMAREIDDEDLWSLEKSLNESYGFRRHKLVSDEEYNSRTLENKEK